MAGLKSPAAVSDDPTRSAEAPGLSTYDTTVERLAWKAAGGDEAARADLPAAMAERGLRRAEHLIAQARQRARERL